MNVIRSKIDPRGAAFRANAAEMDALLEDVRAVAAELGEAERRRGGNRLPAPKEAVQGHPADAKLTRGLGQRLQPSGMSS